MDKAYILPRTSTAGLIALIFAAVAVLIARAYHNTIHAAKSVLKWMKTAHNFTPLENDDDPIILKGYQYVTLCIVCSALCVLLSIQV